MTCRSREGAVCDAEGVCGDGADCAINAAVATPTIDAQVAVQMIFAMSPPRSRSCNEHTARLGAFLKGRQAMPLDHNSFDNDLSRAAGDLNPKSALMPTRALRGARWTTPGLDFHAKRRRRAGGSSASIAAIVVVALRRKPR